MTNFKIGDRVKTIKPCFQDRLKIGSTGTIASIKKKESMFPLLITFDNPPIGINFTDFPMNETELKKC